MRGTEGDGTPQDDEDDEDDEEEEGGAHKALKAAEVGPLPLFFCSDCFVPAGASQAERSRDSCMLAHV